MMLIKQIMVNKIMSNKATQEKKWLLKPILIKVDYLGDKVLEINMFVVFKVNLIIQSWIVMGWYWCYKKCMHWEYDIFHVQRSRWRKPIHGKLINL